MGEVGFEMDSLQAEERRRLPFPSRKVSGLRAGEKLLRGAEAGALLLTASLHNEGLFRALIVWSAQHPCEVGTHPC